MNDGKSAETVAEEGEGVVASTASDGACGFKRFWLASAVSAVGDGIRVTALPLLTASQTRDPAVISLVTAAGALPLLVSPWAGAAADRWNRLSIMIRADIIRLLVMSGLAITVYFDAVSIPLLLVAAFVLGLCEILFGVTSQSFIPQVVDRSRLSAAGGRLQSTTLVCRDSLGPPLGGLLFSVGMAIPFAVDAASFLIGVALLAGVTAVALPKSLEDTKPSWSSMIVEGARYLRNDRLLATLAGVLGVINLVFGAAVAVEVLYALQWLGLEPLGYGIFLTIGGFGGVLGGLSASRLASRLGHFQAAVAGQVLCAAACLLLGLFSVPLLAFAFYFLMFFGTVIYQTLSVSFRQAAVPAHLLGRVNGVYRLFGAGTVPLGAVAGGVLASTRGVQAPFLVAGGVQFLLFAIVGPWLIRNGTARLREV